MNRRELLKRVVVGPGACTLSFREFLSKTAESLIAGIERTIIWNGRSGGKTWFHPRACLVPGCQGSFVLMTCQTITGSDVFSQVHWSITRDEGKTWTTPEPIPSLGRKRVAETTSSPNRRSKNSNPSPVI